MGFLYLPFDRVIYHGPPAAAARADDGHRRLFIVDDDLQVVADLGAGAVSEDVLSLLERVELVGHAGAIVLVITSTGIPRSRALSMVCWVPRDLFRWKAITRSGLVSSISILRTNPARFPSRSHLAGNFSTPSPSIQNAT